MGLEPLDPGQRVGDRVFAAILDAILTGEIPGGTPLRIRPLAEQLGTSVMPVREAITRLEELGLAEALPYRGAVVKEFTAAEMLEVYDVRRLLEVEAARRGAGRADDQLIGRLRAHRSTMVAAVAREEVRLFLDEDEAFLAALYRAGGNACLLETIETLWARCRAYRLVGARVEAWRGEAQPLVAHHDRLIAAAESRDPAAAQRATTDSLDAAMARIRQALHEDGRTTTAGTAPRA